MGIAIAYGLHKLGYQVIITGMMAEGKLKKSPLTYADVNVNELIEGLDKIDDSTKWRLSNWS